MQPKKINRKTQPLRPDQREKLLLQVSSKTKVPKRNFTSSSDRQLRILNKINLMPLTSREEIAKRTGIKRALTERITRPPAKFIRTKFDIINKLKSNHNTQALAYSPKLWAITRTAELAPTHFMPEIYAILLKEAKEKNSDLISAYPSKYSAGSKTYRVPSITTLKELITNSRLRSKENLIEIIKRSKRKTRKPNNFSGEFRKKLFGAAKKLLEKRKYNGGEGFSGEDLQEEIIKMVENETIYFQVSKGNHTRNIEGLWLNHIFNKKTGRLKFFIIDAARKLGPYTRRGKRKRPIADERIEDKRDTSPSNFAIQPITFNQPLTLRERQVFELLRTGATPTEIANALDLSKSMVGEYIRRLRGLIAR